MQYSYLQFAHFATFYWQYAEDSFNFFSSFEKCTLEIVFYRVSHDVLVSSHDFLVGSHQFLVGSHRFLVRSHNLLVFSNWISILLDQKILGNGQKIVGTYQKNMGTHQKLMRSNQVVSVFLFIRILRKGKLLSQSRSVRRNHGEVKSGRFEDPIRLVVLL